LPGVRDASLRRGTQVHPATVWTVGLHGLAVTGGAWLLLRARGVLGWAVLALFLALALSPLVRRLSTRMPRGVAVAVLFLALGGLGAGLAATFAPLLGAQGRALGQALPGLLEQLRASPTLAPLEQRWGLLTRTEAALAATVPQLAGPLLRLLGQAVEWLLAGFTVLALSLLMLLSGEGLFDGLLAWLPPRRRVRVGRMAREMTRAVSGYVAGSLLLSLGGGLVMGVALYVLDVPWFLAVAAALVPLGLLPWVGAALSELLLLGTGFAAGGGRTALWALGTFLAWQQLAHRLAPFVQARTLKMNALAVALAMLVGTSLLGLLGTVVSVPLAGAAQVAFSAALRQRRARWRHHGKPRGGGSPRQLELPLRVNGR
jgi:predicted PurR-regulated permease PerM